MRLTQLRNALQPAEQPSFLSRMPLPQSGRLGALIQAGFLAHSAFTWGHQVYKGWKTGQIYSIRVKDEDLIYPELQRWLISHIPPDERHGLLAISRRQVNEYGESDDDDDPRISQEVAYYYDEQTLVEIDVEGHTISAFVDKGQAEIEEGTKRDLFIKAESIVLQSNSLAGQRAIMDILQKIADECVISSKPHMFTVAKWGGWQRTRPIKREPSSIVLAEGQFERLDEDLTCFLQNEKAYAKIGMPWHRGFLLHGPPGSGKSSTIQALALKHGMDVYYLPLCDIKSDTDLALLFAAIPERSILLIEDIDIAHAAISREDDAVERVSAQGLLNALDGAMTPNGLVVAMTTNHIEELDSALVRKGRCDVQEKLDYLTDEQALRLVRVMTDIEVPSLPPINGREITAAELADLVKQHITEPEVAVFRIITYLLEPQLAEAA